MDGRCLGFHAVCRFEDNLPLEIVIIEAHSHVITYSLILVVADSVAFKFLGLKAPRPVDLSGGGRSIVRGTLRGVPPSPRCTHSSEPRARTRTYPVYTSPDCHQEFSPMAEVNCEVVCTVVKS